MKSVKELINLLLIHEKKFNNSFFMIPSENSISPLAKKAFLHDGYSRYFFDNMNQWGTWAFPGGNIIGKIETDILIPLLKEMTMAKYVNVKPISGLNCMELTLLSYCKRGDSICFMSYELGGHPSGAKIAKNMGLKIIYIPSDESGFDIDWNKFDIILKKFKPKLVYIDQATVLFPVNLSKIKELVKLSSCNTKIHLDSSHINGLILGNVIPNPLKAGVDSFGGSTHKTLAGPHKAFIVTNDKEISKNLTINSEYLISHHHMADVISLTITLLEFQQKNGYEYAQQILKNSKKFAAALDFFKFDVQGKHLGYTACHQVWLDPNNYMNAIEGAKRLFEAGIIINTFKKLPSVNKAAFRIGLNEVTRFGLKEKEMYLLADFFNAILIKKTKNSIVSKEIKKLRHKFNVPKFCFTEKEASNLLSKML
jgi:glycine hydroxymethyltransferase